MGKQFVQYFEIYILGCMTLKFSHKSGYVWIKHSVNENLFNVLTNLTSGKCSYKTRNFIFQEAVTQKKYNCSMLPRAAGTDMDKCWKGHNT